MTTIEIRRTARVELDRHEYATVWHALRTLAAHLDPVTAPNQIERANKLADKLGGLAEQMGATSAGEATIPWGWSPDDRSRPLRPPASASAPDLDLGECDDEDADAPTSNGDQE